MRSRLQADEALVLHASGADRRRTASFYTPPSLTRCLVEETLRALLGDEPAHTAERILRLRICEPAMGCGAFLQEVIDQLTARYLACRNNRRRSPIDVRRHLVSQTVYGVDVNPVAVEWCRTTLAEQGKTSPAHGSPELALRLCTGNSLLGIRRAVWTVEELAGGRQAGAHSDVPRLLRPGQRRGRGEVYHFLVFDDDMLPAAQDRETRRRQPEACRQASAWIRTQARAPWTAEECQAAAGLAASIDRHWETYRRQRVESLESAVPAPDCTGSSFQRLKLLADAWCSFWFWPPEHVATLPHRAEWLAAARRLLEGDARDVKRLVKSIPWLSIVRQVAAEERFHHWELAFPEVLGPGAKNPGFDLVLGNPPWWKVFQPSGDCDPDERRRWLGTTAMLKSRRLVPELAGIQTNLYKSFIVRSWQLLCDSGVGGLLHQENAFDDPAGGLFREAYYRRLVAHYQFKNERMLFAGVGHPESFSINVFCSRPCEPRFESISNLFVPETIAACRTHANTAGPVPGIRTATGDWETRGHASRQITVTRKELAVFGRLLEDRATPFLQARLPQIHSREVLAVLDVFARAKHRLGDRPDAFRATVMFDEAYAQRDGRITRHDGPSYQPEEPADWIVSGPHFSVGTPLAKTARSLCTEKNHYDPIDLTEIPSDYLPRAVYRPGDERGDRSAFTRAIPCWPKSIGSPLTSRYRYAQRRRGSVGVERTLISCILPPGCTHIDAVYSITTADPRLMLVLAATSSSILFDFLVRLTGKTDFRADVVGILPLIDGPWVAPLVHRTLRLNCLTSHYAALWTEMAGASICDEAWTSRDPRLCYQYELPWHALNPSQWQWTTPLRSDFARRQALLEIDVLVARALGLSLDQLLTIYRVQFPVMRAHEQADEFDATGRRLPNTLRRNSGAQELCQARRHWNGRNPLTVTWPIDGGRSSVTKTFYPPFTPVNREADYARAFRGSG